MAAAEVLRVPNRRDLLPAGGLWLRSPDGVLLDPAATALDDPSVETEADGTRTCPSSCRAVLATGRGCGSPR